LYLNFNVLNNEVFETGCDDKLLEIAERGAYLDGLKRLGVVILMSDWADEDWKAKKKNDGNWEFTPIG
jgi:hypothetical protein